VKLAVQQLVIRADADRVFDMLIDPVLFVSWTAEDATLEPTPGGVVRWTHPNGDTVSGRYIIIDRPTSTRFRVRMGADRCRHPARFDAGRDHSHRAA
jgi:uncharacterized protein YndB with AHSA1/START domain